ncbi:MAG: TetR family transcriptional regulator [Diaphorobacter nitroreducens]|uniref:TetR family transcriptional regulator n=2 Tax=Diaphorobacter TaxID=238749 RepID=A0AAX1WXT2_9BURK|nr:MULTISPECIES: TetR family transcriptional regulator [Diaphorobacter]ACM31803.1 transcriptional regulator, TetR family [[Acidovorax] ebreus TPSY]KLR59412.1 TetR family transcriptional regulator [Diaphorobacter sp. J5-51]MBV2215540.1 TetR family transcriptional regulator [Diaphorobacter sp.]ROR50299.1 TetR family transcriptional regulator [Diaphorobacter nitroreducens]WKK89232.1 TetR family transcriptional regulator [Diaphorobacter sp. C33]
MARRTKEDADATRNSLLDAAERVFYEKGVSRASLSDIAQAAGATRGAIYWHFKDKVALFNAMMDRVTHPLEQVGSKSASMATLPPLERLRSMVDFVQRTIVQDERTRRVFEIALYRVEYVNDLAAVRDNHIEGCADFCALIEGELRSAAEDQNLQLPMEPHTAAMGVQALFDGLLQSWLLTHGRFDLVTVSRGAIDAYLRGLGFRL